MTKIKAVFICPFDLDQLTGTPIKAKTTINAVKRFANVTIAQGRNLGIFSFTKETLSILLRERPQVIHCITTLALPSAFLYKIFHWKTKIIFESHGWSFLELKSRALFLKRGLFLLLDYFGLWFSSLVIAISQSQKQFLSKRSWRKNIVVQWCMVENPPPFRRMKNEGPIKVGYLGNASWWQGLPHLIETARMLEGREEIIFQIAGFDWSDQKKFPRLKNIKYFGKIEREKVNQFLQSSDVLISPRVREEVSDLQFPQKFSDYISAGRPVIATAVSDIPEIIKEAKCGIVVDELSADSLKEAIIKFESLGDLERLLWAERAFTFARRHFFFNVLVENLNHHYKGLLNPKSKIKTESKKKALVIGAGIHGSTIAIELAKNNFEVTIIDGKDLLGGTSSGTHNRLHLGYHYPRSVETALECKISFQYFKEHFAETISYPKFYYMIENSSKVSTKQYKDLLNYIDLPAEMEWPDEKYVTKTDLDSSFKVGEAFFDINKLRDIIKDRFKKYKVKTNFDFSIEKAVINHKNILEITSKKGEKLAVVTDIIVNATYTYTNDVQTAFGCTDDLTDYEYENTEVVVVSSNLDIPALTVMDGPFITIVPYGGHKGQFLVYDVVHSRHEKQSGIKFNPDMEKLSNWQKMKEHGRKYYPFFENLKYEGSLWASRPIPKIDDALKNDSRATRIIRHDYPINFYSVLEGKFSSAPMVAEDLVYRIKKEI